MILNIISIILYSILYFVFELKYNLSLLQLNGYNYFSYVKNKYKNSKLFLINVAVIILINILFVFNISFKPILLLFAIYYLIFGIFYIRKCLCNINRYICTKRIFKFYCFFILFLLLSLTLNIMSQTSNKNSNCILLLTINMWLLFVFIFVINCVFEYILLENNIKKAKNIINKYNIKIIAITGSFAKTSVKNILYRILLKKYNVVMTPKSYNTPNGICKAINEADLNNVDYLILEMGAKKKGEIKQLCRWFKPDVGVLTAIGLQHLDTFKNIETIFETKCELQNNLNGNGVMVFNCYNELVCRAKDLFNGEYVSAGVKQNVWYENYVFENGISVFDLCIRGCSKKYKVETKLLGEHNVVNICISVALALKLNVYIEQIITAIGELEQVESRLEISKLPNNVTVINNGYNSNPVTARCSLKVLEGYKNITRIVITPGFVEMGAKQYVLNKEFGKQIAGVANFVVVENEVNKKAIIDGLIEGGIDKEKISYVNCFKDIEFTKFHNAVVLIENDLPSSYK